MGPLPSPWTGVPSKGFSVIALLACVLPRSYSRLPCVVTLGPTSFAAIVSGMSLMHVRPIDMGTSRDTPSTLRAACFSRPLKRIVTGRLGEASQARRRHRDTTNAHMEAGVPT